MVDTVVGLEIERTTTLPNRSPQEVTYSRASEASPAPQVDERRRFVPAGKWGDLIRFDRFNLARAAAIWADLLLHTPLDSSVYRRGLVTVRYKIEHAFTFAQHGNHTGSARLSSLER